MPSPIAFIIPALNEEAALAPMLDGLRAAGCRRERGRRHRGGGQRIARRHAHRGAEARRAGRQRAAPGLWAGMPRGDCRAFQRYGYSGVS